MAERPVRYATMMQKNEPAPSAGRPSSAFPSDLFDQACGRLRLLTGFVVAAFGFDLVLFLIQLGWSMATGQPRPAPIPAVPWINFGTVLLSCGMWWAAGNRRVSVDRLYLLGLSYEVIICFVCAAITYWQYFNETHLLPNLTWVPAIIIMFPLILPGPPRRMLPAAIASGATVPLSILLLDRTGAIDVGDGSAYAPACVGSIFAVVFASFGSKVIYGLGREVARVRALGSYQLESLLGSGGMGEVWRARHRLLARPAAVKFLRRPRDGSAVQPVSEETLRRFEREAQSIANLRSPHTVELFDFGVSDEGEIYYAMELLEGLDTDALVRRYGPVPAERAIYILRQVCHSLSEAESLGLVHRDIKPANIYLCRYGEDHDFVKVLDFGIVKCIREESDRAAMLTGQAVIQGTPAFMAPEQALGNARLDGRADLYALGCVAYWLLTGHLVFEADSPTALLLHHIHTPPTPPSARSELAIPSALDELVLSCLAKNPADRPHSAKELSRRLGRVEGADSWTEERSREWWERHRPATPIAVSESRTTPRA